MERTRTQSPAVFKGLVKGEIIYATYNVRNKKWWKYIQNFETSLLKRGYSVPEIKESVNDVFSNYNRQGEFIRKKKCDSFCIRLVMVTKYNPYRSP